MEPLEEHADDAAWTYRTLEAILARGGWVFGGLFGLAQWAQPQAADPGDQQRVLEFVVDWVCRQPLSTVKAMLAGTEHPEVVISSQAEALRLVTGLYQDGTNNAWLPMAYPEFWCVSRQHRGIRLDETVLSSFRVFPSGSILRTEGARRAIGYRLRPSRIAVALGVGQAARLGNLATGGTRTFDVGAVSTVLNWLEGLKEGSRRLARHLLLSPGDREGYAYLQNPYWFASVVGLHFDHHPRTTHRLMSRNLPEAVQGLVDQLPGSLPLPVVQHLRRALNTFVQGPRVSETKTPLPLLLDENPPTEVPLINGDDLSLMETRPLIFGDDLSFSEMASLINGDDLSLMETRPLINGDVTPPSPLIFGDVTSHFRRCNTTQGFDSSISYTVSISSIISQSSLESISQSSHQEKVQSLKIRDEHLGQTDRRNEILLLKSGSNKNDDQRLKLNRPSSISLEPTLPPPGDLKEWIQPKGSDPLVWPVPIRSKVEEILRCDTTLTEAMCVWTPEGVWALLEGIRVGGSRLDSIPGTLVNALRNQERGSRWLRPSALRLRQAGWFELPEDGTPRELSSRSVAARSLNPYKRMPLGPEDALRRAELLRATPAERPGPQPGQTPVDSSEAYRLWNTLQHGLSTLLPARVYRDWIAPCHAVALDETTLWIQAPSRTIQEWIEQQLMEEIDEVLGTTEHPHVRLVFRHT